MPFGKKKNPAPEMSNHVNGFPTPTLPSVWLFELIQVFELTPPPFLNVLDVNKNPIRLLHIPLHYSSALVVYLVL